MARKSRASFKWTLSSLDSSWVSRGTASLYLFSWRARQASWNALLTSNKAITWIIKSRYKIRFRNDQLHCRANWISVEVPWTLLFDWVDVDMVAYGAHVHESNIHVHVRDYSVESRLHVHKSLCKLM